MPNWLLDALVLVVQAGILWWVKPWLGEKAVQEVRQLYTQQLEVIRQTLDESSRQLTKREEAVLEYLKVARGHLWWLSLGMTSIDMLSPESIAKCAQDLRASLWELAMQRTIAELPFDPSGDGALLGAWKEFDEATTKRTTIVHARVMDLLRASRKLERHRERIAHAQASAASFRELGAAERAKSSLAEAIELQAETDTMFNSVQNAFAQATSIEPYIPELMKVFADFVEQVRQTLHAPTALEKAIRAGLAVARSAKR